MDRWLHSIKRSVTDLDALYAQPRVATISSVDPSTGRVKVAIQPEGVISGWIHDASVIMASNGNAIVAPSSVGDQVFINFLHGDHEHPVVTGRMFSDVDRPPVSPVNGKPIQSGEYGIFTDGVFIHIEGGRITAQATKLKFTGDVEIIGNVKIVGDLDVEGHSHTNGNLDVIGEITATQDIIAGTISTQQHIHTGVKSGGEHTGIPEG